MSDSDDRFYRQRQERLRRSYIEPAYSETGAIIQLAALDYERDKHYFQPPPETFTDIEGEDFYLA